MEDHQSCVSNLGIAKKKTGKVTGLEQDSSA